eukprot:136108-Karenia_brevis.AAC.1
MAKLAHEAYSLFQATTRHQELARRGQIAQSVNNHKLTEKEIAGYRIILKQCHSDRPAFVIEFNENDTKV